MTRIAFFGHDAADAAVRRRVQGFRDDGFDIIGFMMRRREAGDTAWRNIDLGRTFDGAYVQRIRSIFAGARRAAAERDALASADIIYARNLDMLATAFLAKRYAKLDTPVVYESLDVHRLLVRGDPIGWAFRWIEGALLDRSRHLVVSSPGFLENHFEKRYPGRYRATVIENRLAHGASYGPRPDGEPLLPLLQSGPQSGPQSRQTPSQPAAEPLRIGWVGNLRCARSLGLLLDVASRFGERVRIDLHGQPALTEIPDFHERVANLPNVTFHGRYRAPEDLSRIYSGMDVVWAGDFMEAGYNSVWLLPNRLYEGGYFAVPPISPAGTQTARWADARGIGFTAAEDLSQTLPALVAGLIADRAGIAQRRARLLDLPDDVFIQPKGELGALVEAALRQPSGAIGGYSHGAATHPLSKIV